MMISQRHFQLLFIAIMATAMSAVMSFSMMLLNLGWHQDFILLWLKSFAVSTLIAIPTALIVGPIARKLASQLTKTG